MIKVAVSGYFNPLHKGHIKYIQLAKELGDYLIVILNNDNQVRMKGSKKFMDENERKIIMENIKDVDEVIISVDNDLSVCETLKLIHPNIFAKGGDRWSEEIPETKICEELNIKIVDGLGEKIQSSSSLVGENKDGKY